MTDKYKRGKIYKIVCNKTGLQYVGSTCEPTLSRRLAVHKNDYNNYLNKKRRNITSFEVLKNNDYSIILIEDYPCNRKEQLLQRERWFIENTECVNKRTPYISCDEHIEHKKEQQHTYYEKNKDIILERNKKYYDCNKTNILEQKKSYYQEHKDIILENSKIKIDCECGGKYTIQNKTNHFKTKLHKNYCQEITS